MWIFSFSTAAIIFVLSTIAAIWIHVKKCGDQKLATPLNSIIAGTFLSCAILMLPVNIQAFSGDTFFSGTLKTIVLSIYQALKFFLLDADFGLIQDALTGINPTLCAWYSSFAVVLLILAPILTFGFVLSFFRNISAYRRYLAAFQKDVYLFSALNEKTVTLAADLAKRHHACIVFTGVSGQDAAQDEAQMQTVRQIGAICFKTDLLAIPSWFHGQSSRMTFFAMDNDEDKNLLHAFGILAQYKKRPNTVLYILSTSVESELSMASIDRGAVKVHRINEVRALVYRTLYDHGSDLFRHAQPVCDGQKQIGAVIVGMRDHGTEMLKALTWFCQMDGYRVRLDAFDEDSLARSRFAAACPELMSDQYNGVFIPGEAQYHIHIHSGLCFDTQEFADRIKALPSTTYVLICLGSDAQNIRCAVTMRMLFEQMGIHPVIEAIIYDTEKKQALQNAQNYRGQPYDITWIGDQKSLYCEGVILNSQLEQEALRRHLKWGSEEEFWAYEYNYRSSMASALHMRARISCSIPGADQAEEELTAANRDAIQQLEHRRWNAYMRTEGYIYSGSPQKESRNDLGKMHHNLVDFAALSQEDKAKDSAVGTR